MTFAEFSRLILDAASEEPRLRNWYVLRSLDSTNSLGRRVLSSAAPADAAALPAVVVAWGQTAGRGRREHHWESPPGLGVYASLLLAPLPRRRLPLLPLLTAIGLVRVLERHLEAPGKERRLGVRWPNDLMVGSRKIGGVLIETASIAGVDAAAAVVGFGVNYGQGAENLPAPAATSVRLESEHPPSLPRLAVELASSVAAEVERLEETAYAVEEFSRRLLHRPGDRLRCRTADGVLEGDFLGLDEHGLLRLRVGEEVRTLPAGEVLDAIEPGAAFGGDSEADHAYFRAVEDTFIRLRGAPFLLSPSDWRVAAGWRRDGVPLATVQAVLERIIGEREASGEGKRSLSGLRYFDRAVRSSWARSAAMTATGSRAAEPLDVARRLGLLADAVSGSLPEGEALRGRILALEGTTEEVEAQLSQLDAELLDAVRRSLDAGERGSVDAEVAAGLERVGGRLDSDQLSDIRRRLERRALRRIRQLPLLSLFSPAAE